MFLEANLSKFQLLPMPPLINFKLAFLVGRLGRHSQPGLGNMWQAICRQRYCNDMLWDKLPTWLISVLNIFCGKVYLHAAGHRRSSIVLTGWVCSGWRSWQPISWPLTTKPLVCCKSKVRWSRQWRMKELQRIPAASANGMYQSGKLRSLKPLQVCIFHLCHKAHGVAWFWYHSVLPLIKTPAAKLYLSIWWSPLKWFAFNSGCGCSLWVVVSWVLPWCD